VTLQQITDYVDQIENDLAGSYLSGADAVIILQAYASRIQQIEDFLWALLWGLDLNNSTNTGWILSQLGLLLGLPRPDTVNDTEYISLLRARSIANGSDGLAATLQTLANQSSRGTLKMWALPGGALWQYDGTIAGLTAADRLLAEQIRRGSAAGASETYVAASANGATLGALVEYSYSATATTGFFVEEYEAT
jgi:hypothetical protein